MPANLYLSLPIICQSLIPDISISCVKTKVLPLKLFDLDSAAKFTKSCAVEMPITEPVTRLAVIEPSIIGSQNEPNFVDVVAVIVSV